jgi:hypothetical protein
MSGIGCGSAIGGDIESVPSYKLNELYIIYVDLIYCAVYKVRASWKECVCVKLGIPPPPPIADDI